MRTRKLNLDKKIEDFQKIIPLILCDKTECEDYGEYVRCYEDYYKKCKFYLEK